ncbi:MAG TPA: hypothetical protein VNT26_24385, partial [Candidatus Sulfotelmatobacter sp.]|nr:hypothetical protein [Candidatus Sulfotelmatobacter sp.]
LLQVEAASYQTAECRNVALGHAVGSLDLIFEHLKQPQPVVEFVKRQLNNDRDAVKRKATRFLKRHAQPAKTAGARAKSSTEVTRRDQRK